MKKESEKSIESMLLLLKHPYYFFFNITKEAFSKDIIKTNLKFNHYFSNKIINYLTNHSPPTILCKKNQSENNNERVSYHLKKAAMQSISNSTIILKGLKILSLAMVSKQMNLIRAPREILWRTFDWLRIMLAHISP